MKLLLTLLIILVHFIVPNPIVAQADTVDKTICKLAVGYQDVDEIQADLLAAAKREVINELFGEMIVASTAVENFVVTSDQIRTSSIGFVRVDGNADFFQGEGFAEVCVTIQAYVTEEDRAKFIPEKLAKKHCDADENMTTAQLIAYVKEEAVIQALVEYNPKLKGADKESLLQLVQRVSYSESGFVSDTQTYCVTFESEVVPVEITAFLDTFTLQVLPTGSSEITPSANPTPTISSDLVEIAIDGITASSRNSVAYNPENASDGDEKTVWVGGSSSISEEWIEAVFRSPKTISRIGLYRQQNPERAQVKAARLTFTDGSQQEITLKGLAGWNYVDIDPITTDSVKLEISEVNPIGGYVEIVDLAFFGVEAESTIPDVGETLVEITIDGITASSRNSVAYNPENASDGDEKTVWVGGSPYISEEWIEAVFRSPKTISRIGLYRQQKPERAQVKAARLVFSDGSQQEITFKGLAGWNYVDIDPITTDSVKLEISEVNPIGGYVEIVDLAFFGVETESKP